nr:hypothetical protein [Mycobacterium tuberculosis]
MVEHRDINTGVANSGDVNTGAFISGNYSNGAFWRGDYQGLLGFSLPPRRASPNAVPGPHPHRRTGLRRYPRHRHSRDPPRVQRQRRHRQLHCAEHPDSQIDLAATTVSVGLGPITVPHLDIPRVPVTLNYLFGSQPGGPLKIGPITGLFNTPIGLTPWR